MTINLMPDPNLSAVPNPPQPFFGQGVRNMPQPPDPYDKVENSGLQTVAPTLPPIEGVKPALKLPDLKEEIASTPPPVIPKDPSISLPPTNVEEKSVVEPVPLAIVSANLLQTPVIGEKLNNPEPAKINIAENKPEQLNVNAASITTALPTPKLNIPLPKEPMSLPVASQPVGGPPPPPLNIPYKDYPLDYKFPKKRQLSPWLLVIPVVLILLGLIIYGVLYFLATPKSQPTPEDGTTLILKDESSQNIASSPAAVPNLPAKPKIPLENGFGTLPPPAFDSFALNGLSLGGVVVANESTSSAVFEKSNVYEFSGDTNAASSSAIFSPEHPTVSKGISQISSDAFNSQISGQSLYPVINPNQALTNLVSSAVLYGITEKKIDWTKDKLRALVIVDNYIAHYYPPKSKYWYPIYIFEGKGKLVGDAANSNGFKIIFFLPAIAD